MSRRIPPVLRMELDEDERQRIETLKMNLGIKNTSEVVRLALMNEYKRVMGSPTPKTE